MKKKASKSPRCPSCGSKKMALQMVRVKAGRDVPGLVLPPTYHFTCKACGTSCAITPPALARNSHAL